MSHFRLELTNVADYRIRRTDVFKYAILFIYLFFLSCVEICRIFFVLFLLTVDRSGQIMVISIVGAINIVLSVIMVDVIFELG